jgi:hypothetical protein
VLVKSESPAENLLQIMLVSCCPINGWKNNQNFVFEFQNPTDAEYAEIQLLNRKEKASKPCSKAELMSLLNCSNFGEQLILPDDSGNTLFKAPSNYKKIQAENFRSEAKNLI